MLPVSQTNGKPKPKRPSTLVVDLGEARYRKLQDSSYRRSRREGRRVPMTEIARDAIDAHLEREAAERKRTPAVVSA